MAKRSTREAKQPVADKPPPKSTKSKTVDGKRVTPVTEQPASQRVEAPPCPCCRHIYTVIYCTQKPKRYCKCKRCGWTWGVAMDAASPVDNLQTR